MELLLYVSQLISNHCAWQEACRLNADIVMIVKDIFVYILYPKHCNILMLKIWQMT